MSVVPDVSKGRGTLILTGQPKPLWSVEILGTLHPLLVGHDNSVGIEIRYGLDGPVIESRWGRGFPHPSRPALGLTQPPIQWVTGIFPGVKRPGGGVDHPPLCKAEVKERVELYLYSPSGSLWPVRRWPLHLSLPTFPLQSDGIISRILQLDWQVYNFRAPVLLDDRTDLVH
jgi:hypothetical protein